MLFFVASIVLNLLLAALSRFLNWEGRGINKNLLLLFENIDLGMKARSMKNKVANDNVFIHFLAFKRLSLDAFTGETLNVSLKVIKVFQCKSSYILRTVKSKRSDVKATASKLLTPRSKDPTPCILTMICLQYENITSNLPFTVGSNASKICELMQLSPPCALEALQQKCPHIFWLEKSILLAPIRFFSPNLTVAGLIKNRCVLWPLTFIAYDFCYIL
ncbi:Hypothetical predicted protein [Podarcis lilfordi]|uniref:Uncharacterized protein n=1 Tax=Podarcis lilfordi TaxID=74358 RepID=A0AA35PJH6_9SAUR|nr:Hypothetical predicted protein [Podarcis lilfordi]